MATGPSPSTSSNPPTTITVTIDHHREEEEKEEGHKYCRLEMRWQPQLLRRGRRIGAPPLGLRNLGNTCYLNSVLQCLTYTPPLANFCLQFLHSSLCEKQREEEEEELNNNNNNKNGSSSKRDCPFCILEKRIARSLSLDAASDAPSKMSSCLRLYASHFQWGHQEDAHEFLRYVIDACHNTSLALLKDQEKQQLGGGRGIKVTKKRSRPASSTSRATTVVEDIFGGALLSQVRCLSCGCVSSKTDEIMDVSLDLFQSRSLYDAFRRFFQPELLDGDNKYSCSRCKKLSAAKKHMFILQAPNVLVIQLKRFEGINGGKINKDIAFEEVLLLSNFMSKASQDPEPEYNLFGSIVHSGYSPDSGHYYAYVKDPSGCWYCCNDSNVSLSSSQEVLSEKVYILFYLRCNQAPKSVKPILPSDDQKFPESHGKSHLGIPKSLIMTKPIGEGELYSEKIVSSVVKNGKVATSQQIKFGFKSFQKNNSLMQEDRNLKCTNDAKRDKGCSSKQLPISEKHSAVSTAMDVKKSTALNSHEKSNGSSHADRLAHSNSQLAPGNASLIFTVDNPKKSLGTVDGCIKSKTEDQNMLTTGSGLNIQNTLRDNSHGSKSNGLHILKTKRKLSAEDSTAPGSKCSVSDVVKEDASHGSYSIFANKLSPEGLANIIDRISNKAHVKLQSCGWTDEVHDFMRARKRLCIRGAGCPPDHAELRRLLVADAKKNFNYHIPQELKEDLIKDLRQSFLKRDT